MFFYKWTKCVNFLVENEFVYYENLKSTNDEVTRFLDNRLYGEAIIYKILDNLWILFFYFFFKQQSGWQ